MERSMASLEDENRGSLRMDDDLAFLISEISKADGLNFSDSSGDLTLEDSSASSFASILEMQQQAFLDHKKLQREYSQKMKSDVTGKSWKFVERMSQECQALPNQDGCIRPVSLDNLVEFTERLMVNQDNFKFEGRPYEIDIGYYYTNKENMESIRMNGMITTKVNPNGSNNGVFTGDDPYEFNGCGNVGVMVARLKGFSRGERANLYTCIKGKTLDDRYALVLNEATQCLALMEFDADMIDMTHEKSPFNNLVYKYHCRLQHLIDQFFNDGKHSDIARPTRTPRRSRLTNRSAAASDELSGMQ